MLSDAIDAFLRADGALGREVCARDDQVDALHESVFRILLTHMMADARTITPSLELLLVSRNLERVADLATNIGEDAVFLAEGKQIKHRDFERLIAQAGCLLSYDPACIRMRLKCHPRSRDPGEQRRAPPRAGDVRIAAIDIGSNSIRQIVADVSPDGAIRVVDEMKAAPRLGAGLDATGVLGATRDGARRRGDRAHGDARPAARRESASRPWPRARCATRPTARSSLARVRQETGLERARARRRGRGAAVASAARWRTSISASGRAVVMDIGGGSLELALSADGVLDDLISLPFGAIRLTERYFARGHRAARRCASCARRCGGRSREVLPRRDWRGAQVIGSGGTFTNLAGMLLARQRHARRAQRARARVVPRVEVEHILDALAAMPPEERRRVPGLNPERADIIVAGLAVAAEVLARLESRELHRVALRHSRRAAAASSRASRPPSRIPARRASDRCASSPSAATTRSRTRTQVQRLALRLFDAIGARIGCAPDERQTLADAALLHDVGYHINYDRHHKHSYHLILHAELLGMTPGGTGGDRQRGALPPRRARRSASIATSARSIASCATRIVRLAAILRVADGFDRGHVGAVGELKVRWLAARDPHHAASRAGRRTSMRLELWGAHRKSELLADAGRRPGGDRGAGRIGAVVRRRCEDGRRDESRRRDGAASSILTRSDVTVAVRFRPPTPRSECAVLA